MYISRADVAHVDLEPLRPFVAGEGFFWTREHYKLLAHLSTTVGKRTIFDIGTHLGDSAVALSYGGVPVETFDIVDNVLHRSCARGETCGGYGSTRTWLRVHGGP